MVTSFLVEKVVGMGCAFCLVYQSEYLDQIIQITTTNIPFHSLHHNNCTGKASHISLIIRQSFFPSKTIPKI